MNSDRIPAPLEAKLTIKIFARSLRENEPSPPKYPYQANTLRDGSDSDTKTHNSPTNSENKPGKRLSCKRP